MLGKEGIRPVVMVRAAASASLSLTQTAAQSHTDPGIQDLERETTLCNRLATSMRELPWKHHRAVLSAGF
jgi:hypothetical protein